MRRTMPGRVWLAVGMLSLFALTLYTKSPTPASADEKTLCRSAPSRPPLPTLRARATAPRQ